MSGRRRAVGVLGVALLGAAATAHAAPVDPAALARALERAPVQVVGQPKLTLAAPQVAALRRQIAQQDPGRIWLAVTPALTRPQTRRLANDLSAHLNADGGGTVVVVAGAPVWGTTSWEDAEAITARLRRAFGDDAPLAVQARRAIASIAAGDAAAGHPRLRPASTPAAAGGGASGLVVPAIVLGALALAGAAVAVPRLRHAARAGHERREQRADDRADARAALVSLGEAIEALDIDSSLPSAPAAAQSEYAAALDCYQEAERRLAHADDDYQLRRAREALARGRQHVEAAARRFDAAPGAAGGG